MLTNSSVTLIRKSPIKHFIYSERSGPTAQTEAFNRVNRTDERTARRKPLCNEWLKNNRPEILKGYLLIKPNNPEDSSPNNMILTQQN